MSKRSNEFEDIGPSPKQYKEAKGVQYPRFSWEFNPKFISEMHSHVLPLYMEELKGIFTDKHDDIIVEYVSISLPTLTIKFVITPLAQRIRPMTPIIGIMFTISDIIRNDPNSTLKCISNEESIIILEEMFGKMECDFLTYFDIAGLSLISRCFQESQILNLFDYCDLTYTGNRMRFQGMLQNDLVTLQTFDLYSDRLVCTGTNSFGTRVELLWTPKKASILLTFKLAPTDFLEEYSRISDQGYSTGYDAHDLIESRQSKYTMLPSGICKHCTLFQLTVFHPDFMEDFYNFKYYPLFLSEQHEILIISSIINLESSKGFLRLRNGEIMCLNQSARSGTHKLLFFKMVSTTGLLHFNAVQPWDDQMPNRVSYSLIGSQMMREFDTSKDLSQLVTMISKFSGEIPCNEMIEDMEMNIKFHRKDSIIETNITTYGIFVDLQLVMGNALIPNDFFNIFILAKNSSDSGISSSDEADPDHLDLYIIKIVISYSNQMIIYQRLCEIRSDDLIHQHPVLLKKIVMSMSFNLLAKNLGNAWNDENSRYSDVFLVFENDN